MLEIKRRFQDISEGLDERQRMFLDSLVHRMTAAFLDGDSIRIPNVGTLSVSSKKVTHKPEKFFKGFFKLDDLLKDKLFSRLKNDK